jgi:hypothetical protein
MEMACVYALQLNNCSYFLFQFVQVEHTHWDWFLEMYLYVCLVLI